jgi:rubrerythrin
MSSLFDDALARAINAEPWQPLPGMVKLRCQHCAYWFATHDADEQPYCPDCRIRLRRAVGQGEGDGPSQ